MALSDPAPERDGDFGTNAALRAFAREPSAVARTFDDGHLTAYRHPSEAHGLLIALVVVVLTVAMAFKIAPVMGMGIAGVLLLTAVVTRLNVAQQLAGAAEVTPTQFAHLYAMVAELRERFAMPRTRVFVAQSPVINAAASGFREPYVVVLNSALVEALDDGELKSVLGHEMGHIKLGHTRLGVLLGGLDTRGIALPFPINLVAGLRDAVFLWWGRSKEMSADRAGIIACGRLSKAISAQLKISVGPTLYQHVNLDDLARQAAGLRTGVGRVEGFVSQLGSSHPFLINRIAAMMDFVGDPDDDTRPRERRAPERPRGLLRERRASGGARAYELNEQPVLAGRSPSSDVQLRDRTASRRHFQVRWDDHGYVLEDLGSNNGTFVNGQLVHTARLQDGDVIRAGFVELEFTLTG